MVTNLNFSSRTVGWFVCNREKKKYIEKKISYQNFTPFCMHLQHILCLGTILLTQCQTSWS